MFKIFPGFHLVEEYQKKRKERRLADDQTLSKTIKIIAAVGISLILWLLPTDSFGIEGLTYVEQRVIAVFAFATLMWISYRCEHRWFGYSYRYSSECNCIEVFE